MKILSRLRWKVINFLEKLNVRYVKLNKCSMWGWAYFYPPETKKRKRNQFLILSLVGLENLCDLDILSRGVFQTWLHVWQVPNAYLIDVWQIFLFPVDSWWNKKNIRIKCLSFWKCKYGVWGNIMTDVIRQMLTFVRLLLGNRHRQRTKLTNAQDFAGIWNM